MWTWRVDARHEDKRQQGTIEPLLRTVPANSKVFFAQFTEYAEKADLNECC